ncbi:pilin N-terminal domain-containing protein [Anaerococcus nagyae]|uniref:pilin N-terminal domain-containing protein n=1 Tax=Anaerococcus nagyae TaxID=1755241 RepID=UPI0037362612
MKKATNRILSFLSAFAMVLGILVAPFTSANAAEGDADPAPETPSATSDVTETLTIHKILMDKKAFGDFNEGTKGKNGTEFDGNKITSLQDFFLAKDKNNEYVGSAKEIEGVYFKLQKPAKDGTDPDVNKDSDWVDLGEGYQGLTTANGLEIKDVSKLEGKYRIVEDLTKSTYKGEDEETLAAAKAVPSVITLPLVNNKGVVTDAHVYPKNTQQKPQIDKNFTKDSALEHAEGFDKAEEGAGADAGAKYENYEKTKETAKAYVGKKIPYEVKTKILKDSHYKKLVWSDEMTKGLTYNEDLKVSGAGLAEEDYRVVASEQGFVLELLESGLDKVEKAAKADDVEITLTYSATVNSEAEVDTPDDNIIKLDYSNNPSNDNESKTVKPKNQEIKVTKTWAKENTVTEDDKDAKVVYILQKKDGKNWADVDSVTKTYDEENPSESFNHTFTGLDDNSEYRVIERVSGYAPEYIKKGEDGVVEINNEKDTKNPKTLQPTKVSVVTGGKKFVKTNQDGTERLEGAEFYVKNAEGKYLVEKATDTEAVKAAKAELDKAVEEFNKLSAEEQNGDAGKTAQAKVDEKQAAYDKAVKANASGYEWGDKKDAVVLTSDKEGKFEITGLEYGNYKLEENEAPEGYAKLDANEKQLEFKVKKGSYSTEDVNIKYNAADNDESAKQIKNKKVTIPQTGGIGSLIFIVAGIVIMAIAFAVKRRNSYEEA